MKYYQFFGDTNEKFEQLFNSSFDEINYSDDEIKDMKLEAKTILKENQKTEIFKV